MSLPLSRDIINAIAKDSANKQMRAAGRTAWSEEDYNLACEMYEYLFKIMVAPENLAHATPMGRA